MGGSDGRSSLALLMAAVLLTTSSAAPTVVQASEDERKLPCENCAALPVDKAYDEPAALIRVTWKPQQDVRLNYWAAPAGSNPYTGAYWSGGCVDGSRPSEPAQPLVLTEAWVGGKNLWYEPGSFELVAEAHACVFADDIDEKDPAREGPRHRAICAAVPSVEVTAKIEHYRAGEQAPHAVDPPVGPMSAPVTLYPCETKPGQPAPDPDKYRRILATFDWDPDNGVSNPQVAKPRLGQTDGAQAAEPGSLPPGTMAAAPPDSYEEPASQEAPVAGDAPASGADEPRDSAESDDAGETTPADWPQQVLSEEGYLSASRLLWGIALDPQIPDKTRDEAIALALLLGLLRSPDAPTAAAGSAPDVASAPDESDDAERIAAEIRQLLLATEAALPTDTSIALQMYWLLLRPDDTDTEQDADAATPPTTKSGPIPPTLTDEQRTKFDKQGRVWAKLPAKAKIESGRKKAKEQTLRTKVWYQLKIDSDGSQVFYDQNGKYIGTKPAAKGKPVQVTVWVDWSEEE